MQVHALINIILSSLPVVERQTNYYQLIICVSATIVLLLILIVNLFYHGYFRYLFTKVFRNDSSVRNSDESNYAVNQASVITGIMAIISITTALFTLLIYTTPVNFMPNYKPFEIYLLIFLIVLCFTIFYKTSLYLLGYILNLNQVTLKYSSITSDIFSMMGLIIFPFFLISTFSDEWLQNMLIFSMLAIVILAFAVRLYNFYSTLFKIKFLNHYAILYFCMFEILPVLLIVKIAKSLSVV